MSALAVVRWLTLNDPDVATELLDHRTRTLHALQAAAVERITAYQPAGHLVVPLDDPTFEFAVIDARGLAAGVRRWFEQDGEPENPHGP